MITALLLSVALLVQGPGAAPSRAAPPSQPPAASAAPAIHVPMGEAIEALLGTIHGHPSPERWRALGPGAVAPLARIAADAAAMPGRRARAALGLSHLGGARASLALAALAGDDGAPFGVRAAALEGAGRLLPAVELRARLGPVLEGARRPADRAVAAEVLADRAPDQCPAVRSRATREAAADRPGFDRALARCAAAGR